MIRSSHGLTLIEAAIALALAATLFAVGIPAYERRVARAAVADGVELAAPAKTLVEDYVAQHDQLPSTEDIALPFVTSRSVVGVSWVGAGRSGSIRVATQSASGDDPALDGKVIVLTASYDPRTKRLAWACGGDNGTSVPAPLLPAGCGGS